MDESSLYFPEFEGAESGQKQRGQGDLESSLRGVSIASNEAISLSLDDSNKEIASSFALQKTRNDEYVTAQESVIASHAKRGVAIHNENPSSASPSFDAIDCAWRATAGAVARNDDSKTRPQSSLQEASIASNEAISLLLDDSNKEIASSFASQKTRNDEYVTAQESVIASRAKRGVAIHNENPSSASPSFDAIDCAWRATAGAVARNDDSIFTNANNQQSAAKPLSVSQVTEQIRNLLERNLSEVVVVGEVGTLSTASSGHRYFTLKDGEKAAINCALFRGSSSANSAALAVGMRVVVRGRLSVYAPKGSYSIVAQSVTPDGVGAMIEAFNALKERLKNAGYFDAAAKKPMPRFPRRVALITSKNGAVIHDMLRVAQKRWNLARFTLFDAPVQGANAGEILAQRLKTADSFFNTPQAFDVIVLARGGGSMEDLWCFNDATLADAIFAAKTPIISAVGHESDFSISDFVADLRAPTPSAAMEMLLPDATEWRLRLDELAGELNFKMDSLLGGKFSELAELKSRLGEFDFSVLYKKNTERIGELFEWLNTALLSVFRQKNDEIVAIESALSALNPERLCQSGFVQITKDGKIADLASIALDEHFTLSNAKSTITAKRV